MYAEYSKRLGSISPQQFQKALDRFNLGQFISAEAIPFGLFGQNVFVTSSSGDYVLRGAAHYDWQFPKEQFIAHLLHDQTNVPVPTPYLLDTDETIFGWKHGYVIMPRMPGLQLASAEVLERLAFHDRKAIAYTLGENLRAVQQAQWRHAGHYDLKAQTIVPFQHGFSEWLVSELRRLLQQSLSYETGATQADQRWVERVIRQSEAALHVPYTPVLVLHDYKEGNLTVQKQNDRWKISGVFDFMEAVFGDGEYDLVRQLAVYLEENDLFWAQAFLEGYQQIASVRPQAAQRLSVYMLYERLIVWEYFHRPANMSQWMYSDQSVEEWITPYLSKLETLL